MSGSLPGQTLRWTPHSAADASETGAEGDRDFAGSMKQLSNLVPDPATDGVWVSRPAAIRQTAFATFTSPGFVSGLLVVGTRAYGMIASARFAGKDEPFVFDLVSGNFVAVSGVLATNTPTSLATTGTWTPPSLSLVGQYVVVCHPGFDGVTNFVGWINVSTPSAPAWSAGNTATNALPSVPVACAQFNGRAYYLCNPSGANPAALISDSLDPTKRTNGTYTITFGDNLPLVAAAGQPLSNQLGGIIQALMVFKANNIFQITGDPTSNNLSVNSLNVAIGTLAPASVCITPLGLAFVAPDGLRFIDQDAHVSDPVGFRGDGITVPLKSALTPSRVVAACNATTIRITVQNGAVSGAPQQEWCFDLQRKVWYGPNTFPASLIQPYGLSFIMTPIGVLASLWQSDIIPSAASTYVENGAALSWTWQTSLLPMQQDFMNSYVIVESQLWAGFDAASSLFTVQAQDENANGLSTCQVTGKVTSGGAWGTGKWGQMIWGGVSAALSPRRLNWTIPLVFARLSIKATGLSAAGVRLGDFVARIRQCGFVPNQ